MHRAPAVFGLLVVVLASLRSERPAFADVVDRASVRYSCSETGGSARPRFIMEREIAFFARIEALIEEGSIPDEFLERYQRIATSRIIAEEMLSSLQLETGKEPVKLLEYAAREREALEARVGGAKLLASARTAEGISEAEFSRLVLKRVRAMAYADRSANGLFQPSEENLYNAWRTLSHPYKDSRFEDARERFAAYYALERFRTLETDFLQSARSRVVLRYL
jgi:hypothetical protein